MVLDTCYGKPEDELDMRAWLDTHRLPQSTADVLLKNGARCIEDVRELARSFPELLQEELPVLDHKKLMRAVATSKPIKEE